jgi:DeoR/GlpR family transcriptional regulator of sugar metabolism
MIDDRLNNIVEIINQKRSVSVSELVRQLNVSEMTIWRDLKTLENQGVIRRVRGGAVAVEVKKEKGPTNQFDEPQFILKQKLYSAAKSKIAQYAAREFVDPGEIVILEGGTTVASMIPFLYQQNLTILTNGLNTLMMASPLLSHLSLMSCGGILRDVSLTFVGPQAISFFNSFRASKAFFGCSGFTLQDGFTDPNPLEIQVKHAMRKSAEKAIMLLDSSKFGHRSLSTVLNLDEIDVLVTDKNAPEEALDTIRKAGIDVRIC